MVHSAGDLLAAGFAGADRLSVCVAAFVAVPHYRYRGGRSAGTSERDHLSAGAHGSSDLIAGLEIQSVLRLPLSP